MKVKLTFYSEVSSKHKLDLNKLFFKLAQLSNSNRITLYGGGALLMELERNFKYLLNAKLTFSILEGKETGAVVMDTRISNWQQQPVESVEETVKRFENTEWSDVGIEVLLTGQKAVFEVVDTHTYTHTFHKRCFN